MNSLTNISKADLQQNTCTIISVILWILNLSMVFRHIRIRCSYLAILPHSQHGIFLFTSRCVRYIPRCILGGRSIFLCTESNSFARLLFYHSLCVQTLAPYVTIPFGMTSWYILTILRESLYSVFELFIQNYFNFLNSFSFPIIAFNDRVPL